MLTALQAVFSPLPIEGKIIKCIPRTVATSCVLLRDCDSSQNCPWMRFLPLQRTPSTHLQLYNKAHGHSSGPRRVLWAQPCPTNANSWCSEVSQREAIYQGCRSSADFALPRHKASSQQHHSQLPLIFSVPWSRQESRLLLHLPRSRAVPPAPPEVIRVSTQPRAVRQGWGLLLTQGHLDGTEQDAPGQHPSQTGSSLPSGERDLGLCQSLSLLSVYFCLPALSSPTTPGFT